jgi:hypothetical protein
VQQLAVASFLPGKQQANMQCMQEQSTDSASSRLQHQTQVCRCITDPALPPAVPHTCALKYRYMLYIHEVAQNSICHQLSLCGAKFTPIAGTAAHMLE